MPFGRRRFAALVIHEGGWRAHFHPLNLGDPAEYETEDALRAACASNAGAEPDGEEQLAIRAFESKARGRGFARASVDAAAARAAQLPAIDPCDVGERALIERFRARAMQRNETAREAGSIEKSGDLLRDILGVLDRHLPKPKGRAA